MNSADICRKNGWTVGTVLQSDEGNGPEMIVITTIGKSAVLAEYIGDDEGATEHTWDLSFRDWAKVETTNDYSEKVKAAVCRLLDHVAKSKHNMLDLDTDEEFPTVHAWIGGYSYWSKGAMKDNGESLSFLECCEKVLAEIEVHEVSEPVAKTS